MTQPEYDSEKKKTTIPAPTNLHEAGGVIVVLGSTLRTTLEKLIIKEPAISSEWLDAFEAQVIRDAKNTVTEGIDIASDARGIGIGVAMVQTFFDVIRRKIAIKDDDAGAR